MSDILTAELVVPTYEVIPPTYKRADEIASMKEVWAMQQEVVGYSGRWGRVIRASDSSELDIFFLANGKIDKAALETFGGGSDDLEIVLIAGQKGFSDATPPAANRPRIMTSGVVHTTNGEVSIDFGTSTDVHYFNTTMPYVAATNPLSISVIYNSTDVSSSLQAIFDTGTAGLKGPRSYLSSGSQSYQTRRLITEQLNGTARVDDTTYLSTFICDRTNLKSYLNGSFEATDGDNDSDFNSDTYFTIGIRATANNPFSGSMQFIGVWQSDESANQTELYDELNDRYNIDGLYVEPEPIYTENKYYFASQTYTTKSTDTLANVQFKGDLTKAFSLEKILGFFVHGTQSSTNVGSFTLANETGRYDELIDLKIRDARIVFKIVDEDASYDTAVQVGEYLIDQFKNNGDTEVVLSMTDKIALLDKNTVHSFFPETLPFVNNRKVAQPIPLGYVYQADIPVVDGSTGKYQCIPEYFSVVDAAIFNANHAIRDRADPFVVTTDYVALFDIAPVELAIGIDLVNAPDGTITADYLGFRYDRSGTPIFPNLFNGFIGKLLVESGGFDAADIDFISAATLQTALGYNYGYYVKTPTNIKSILDAAVASHGGFYYQNNDGKIVFDYLQEPDVTSTFDINSINQKTGISVEMDLAPGLSDTVNARKNVYVFSYDDVRDVGGLSEEDKQAASREYAIQAKSPVTLAGNRAFDEAYAHARNGYEIPTILVNQADADGLVTQLEDLYGQVRKIYTVKYEEDNVLNMLQRELNETINIKHNRFGLDAGKNLRIISIKISDISKNQIEIRAWG